MIQLIYASAATTPLDEAELADLVERARLNNASHGVTGLLLYDQGTFLQLLEGPEGEVRPLYDKITQDPRHDKVVLLFKGEIEERGFDEWRMGFVDIHAQGLRELPGFVESWSPSHYLQSKEPDGALAREAIERFREGGLCRSIH